MANTHALIHLCSLSCLLSPTVLPCSRFSCLKQQLTYHFSINLHFLNTTGCFPSAFFRRGTLKRPWKTTPRLRKLICCNASRTKYIPAAWKSRELHKSHAKPQLSPSNLKQNTKEMPTSAATENDTLRYLDKAVEKKVIQFHWYFLSCSEDNCH